MKNQNEKLLDAWLRLSTVISNEKIASDIPYNEALICNLLYKHEAAHPETGITATALCRQSKMLKSQMNRTLQSMEEKNMITRKRSDTDKRQVFITLNADCELYREQHQKALDLIDALLAKIGIEKSDEILEIFTLISNTAEEVMK